MVRTSQADKNFNIDVRVFYESASSLIVQNLCLITYLAFRIGHRLRRFLPCLLFFDFADSRHERTWSHPILEPGNTRMLRYEPAKIRSRISTCTTAEEHCSVSVAASIADPDRHVQRLDLWVVDGK